MSNQKFSILGIILLMPLFASAHGEDILLTFGLSIVLTLIYIVVLFFFKAQVIPKIFALLIYVVSIVLAYKYIDNIPYNDNKVYINSVIGVFPTLVAIISLLTLRFFKKAKG